MAYAASRDHIALFMEMRLGKSIVSIRWAAPFTGRRLVVAPLSTLRGWERELVQDGRAPIVWLTGCDAKTRVGRAAGTRDGWFLINYEALRAWKGAHYIPWSTVILDESTRIRNSKALITKVLTRKFSDVPHRAILTGMPNPESPMDFFEQMRFISDDGTFMRFSNFWAWRERLFLQIGYDWVPKTKMPGKIPSAREAIKRAVHAESFVLSRKEAGIGSTKIYETRTVPMDPAQRRAIKDIVKHFRYDVLETKSAGVQFLWQQRVAGGFSPDRENPEWISSRKVDELVTLLKTELKKEQVVIWFRFNEELGAAYHTLTESGISCVAITGASSPDRRNKRQLQFMAGKAQAMLIQIGVGRYGLDLSCADTAIYYSNSYENEARAQSEDRIIHVRKTTPVLYIDLVTEGSTDEDAVDVLREKHADAQTFMRRLLERIRTRYGRTQPSHANA